MRRLLWLTKDGYLDLSKFPIDSILAQALREERAKFLGALSLLHSMHRMGRQEAGVFLLGLLMDCPDDWEKRGEIVRALKGFHTKGCADLLLGELRRVTSSNTTRRYLATVLDVLSTMPRELVRPQLEALSEDKRFSHRMRHKFRLISNGYLDDMAH